MTKEALRMTGFDAMFCGHIHRWRVDEPGKGVSNAEFPVISNPNMERMEVTATKDSLQIRTFDTKGANTHNHTVSFRR